MRRVLPILMVLALPASAAQVDLELLPMTDISRSMSPAELALQRQGDVEALRSDAVAAALGRAPSCCRSPNGRISPGR
jgi:hypothetical protein